MKINSCNQILQNKVNKKTKKQSQILGWVVGSMLYLNTFIMFIPSNYDRFTKTIKRSYTGIVKSLLPNDQKGACRILVHGVYGELFDIDKLPIAYPIYDLVFNKSGSGRLITPKIDSVVKVTFDGSIYEPRYYGIENQDTSSLINESSYENSKLILNDEEESLSISYNRKDGIFIKLGESFLTIKPDKSIMINHEGSTSTINLRDGDIDIVSNSSISNSASSEITINAPYIHNNGNRTDIGSNPIYSNVNGEILVELLKGIATIIDQKYPTSSGITTSLVNSIIPNLISNTVKTSP